MEKLLPAIPAKRYFTIGEVSDKCVKADMALAAAVVDFVRRGGALPLPEKRP